MDAIIMKDNKQVVSFFKKLETMFEKIDAIKENARPLLNGERYMTDKELSLKLKISSKNIARIQKQWFATLYFTWWKNII